LIAFAIIFAGALLGVLLRRGLPGHHLSDEAKDVVRLGTGLVGTIAALVLGLLTATAKGSYDTRSTQVGLLTANIILLDQLLAQYGPETRPIRDLVRHAIDPIIDRIWGESASTTDAQAPFQATGASDVVYAQIQQLVPKNDLQRSMKERGLQMVTDILQTRLLLFVEARSSIPMPFLVVLIFWLTIIFASFSLFSRLNATLIAALFVFAMSAAGAIYLVLELSHPFAGLMQISSAPLRNALAPLAP
jgi:hypothetical protein